MIKAGTTYDMIIIGAGVSGCIMAQEFTDAGMKCLIIEAGKHYFPETYPRNEIDGNSQLYWSGGIELTTTADIGLLRPKVVGGGSIVNQALIDRFDDIALDSWRDVSGVTFFNRHDLAPWYDIAESYIAKQTIEEKYRTKNAQIFTKGLTQLGHKFASLTRAQKDCRYEEGNDCIECLNGCRIGSKQSSSITALPKALSKGCHLLSEFEVNKIVKRKDVYTITGRSSVGEERTFRSRFITLASGAIGNSKLLIQSGHTQHSTQIGKSFYTHPQYMALGVYEQEVNAQKGAWQSVKSDDPNFRANFFKLENVFAPPVGLSMLVPGFGKGHHQMMKKVTHMSCAEVAVRDQNPGTIEVKKDGTLKVTKIIDSRDQATINKGMKVIRQMFEATGAKTVLEGKVKVGLHLMGGCGMGINPKSSVVSPHFNLHHDKDIFCADSSIFPNAPGINPSLTIMALSRMASKQIIQGSSR